MQIMNVKKAQKRLMSAAERLTGRLPSQKLPEKAAKSKDWISAKIC